MRYLSWHARNSSFLTVHSVGNGVAIGVGATVAVGCGGVSIVSIYINGVHTFLKCSMNASATSSSTQCILTFSNCVRHVEHFSRRLLAAEYRDRVIHSISSCLRVVAHSDGSRVVLDTGTLCLLLTASQRAVANAHNRSSTAKTTVLASMAATFS